MRHLPVLFAAALAGSLTLGATNAHATDPQAESLYQEGRRAAAVKDWDTACRKFKESHDREAAPGTLLNLGDCEEKRGRVLTAMNHFAAAARLFRTGDERGSYARQRATALERRVPKLTLRLHASSPTGTTIERDGTALEPGALGTAVGVEPGEHLLVVRAPGRLDVKTTVRIAESESRELELAAGVAVPASEAAVTSAPAQQKLEKPTPASRPSRIIDLSSTSADSGSSGSTARTLGFVSLGVGGAALALGVVGGLKTLSAKQVVDQHCSNGCDPEGESAQKDGRTWSTVGTLGFVVGGVGLATGAGLLIFAPSKSAAGAGMGQRPQKGLTAQPVAGGATVRWSSTF